MPSEEFPITEMLAAMEQGGDEAREHLWTTVHEELRGIAGRLMARERPGHTLQPTALVHEAYARLLGAARVTQRDRRYFFAAAAEAMRRILVEHARRHRRREGIAAREELPPDGRMVDGGREAHDPYESMVRLDPALESLREHDERSYDVVMLRFFAGLTVEQTADALDTSTRTVKRCWNYARAWLLDRTDVGEER